MWVKITKACSKNGVSGVYVEIVAIVGISNSLPLFIWYLKVTRPRTVVGGEVLTERNMCDVLRWTRV
jgi:hypothetical protein